MKTYGSRRSFGYSGGQELVRKLHQYGLRNLWIWIILWNVSVILTIVRFTIVFLETTITYFGSYCSISKEYMDCIKQYFGPLHVTWRRSKCPSVLLFILHYHEHQHTYMPLQFTGVLFIIYLYFSMYLYSTFIVTTVSHIFTLCGRVSISSTVRSGTRRSSVSENVNLMTTVCISGLNYRNWITMHRTEGIKNLWDVMPSSGVERIANTSHPEAGGRMF